jgi:hypothetical protein
VINLWEKGQGL